jgi:hypothetical protein
VFEQAKKSLTLYISILGLWFMLDDIQKRLDDMYEVTNKNLREANKAQYDGWIQKLESDFNSALEKAKQASSSGNISDYLYWKTQAETIAPNLRFWREQAPKFI